MNKLPDGWRWATLGEVCNINPPRPSLSRSDDEPTTFVPMSAIGEGSGSVDRPELRSFREVRKGYTYFEEGDVLFAKITPCMQNGKHAIARNLVGEFGFGTTELHVLRSGPEICSEWVHGYLRQPGILQAATEYFTGTVGQQRLPEDFLVSLEIPLPPLSEQRRIADLFRKQMDAAKTARCNAEAQLEAARALSAAYLRAVFNSPEAQSWPRKRIGDFARVQSGYAFKSEWFSDTGIRLLRNANIFQGRIEWEQTARLPDNRRTEFPDYEMAVGDIVLSLDRPVVNNGLKLARVTASDVPSLLLQRVGRFKLRSDIEADFLYAFLKSESFIAAITQHDQSLGVPHVSPFQVEAVELPLPSLSEQLRIASKLGEKLAGAAQVRRSLEEQLVAIEKMPAALLRRAFRGDI